MSQKLNTKLASETVQLLNKALNLETSLRSDSVEESENALNEALGVLTAVSSRITAAFLINKLRTANNPDEVSSAAEGIVTMYSLNFDSLLTAELSKFAAEVAAMVEKEGAGTNKPTTH